MHFNKILNKTQLGVCACHCFSFWPSNLAPLKKETVFTSSFFICLPEELRILVLSRFHMDVSHWFWAFENANRCVLLIVNQTRFVLIWRMTTPFRLETKCSIPRSEIKSLFICQGFMLFYISFYSRF